MSNGRGYGAPSLKAYDDMRTTGQFLFVVMNGSNIVDVSGANGDSVGILRNKPNTGEAANIWRVGEVGKVEVGTTGVTAGNQLTSDSAGAAEPVDNAGEWCSAIALQTGVDGDIIEVIVTCGDAHASL